MAKVKINGIKKVTDNIKKMFDEIRKDEKLLNQVGEDTVQYTVFRARVGTSLATGTKFPKLQANTIKQREYLEFNNVMHETFKPNRSNVTATGQLLDSIKVIKVKSSDGLVDIGPSGTRRPYKKSDDTPIKGQELNNATVYGYLKEKGFGIFGKDDRLTKRLSNIVKRFIRSSILKSFKK